MSKALKHWYMENCERHPKRTLKEIIADHLSYGRVSKGDKLRFLGLAAAGEAGEIANDLKKEWRGDRKYRGKAGREVFLAKLDSEIVDLANYVFMLAQERGMDLEAAMEKKLIEVEARDDDWNKKSAHNPWDNSCVPKLKPAKQKDIFTKAERAQDHERKVRSAMARFHESWNELPAATLREYAASYSGIATEALLRMANNVERRARKAKK